MRLGITLLIIFIMKQLLFRIHRLMVENKNKKITELPLLDAPSLSGLTVIVEDGVTFNLHMILQTLQNL